jgi:hypothetical protein
MMKIRVVVEDDRPEVTPKNLADATNNIETMLTALMAFAAQPEVLPVFRSWLAGEIDNAGISGDISQWIRDLRKEHLATLSQAFLAGRDPDEIALVVTVV